MANYDRNDLDKQANAGLGILGLLGLATVGGIAKAAHNQKKAEKIAALTKAKEELISERQNIRYKLSKLRGGFIKEAWNYGEIKNLELQEEEIDELINQINEKLGELN